MGYPASRRITVKRLRIGDCVSLADGRIGRVRGTVGRKYRVRVRRETSATHQFVELAARNLTRVKCPKGWMSPEGYARYLKTTLAKMRERRTASMKTHEFR